MKRISLILLFLVNNIAFSQEQFKLELTAPVFENDSILLAPPPTTKNIISLYALQLNTDKNVKSIGNSKGALIKIQPQNAISGTVPCSLPVMLMGLKEDRKGFNQSKIFFIENDLKIHVIDKDLNLILSSNALINNDYKKLKEYLQKADEKLKPFEKNDPSAIENKDKLLKAYIRRNPESFPAFWEIIDNFSKYGFHKGYLGDLPLFSKKVKASSCFKDFEKILLLENSTNVGGNFPEINFGPEGKITKSEFEDHKITLIDYWSTSCKPCIQELPELVKLHAKYKDKGVNFISVADDRIQQRIDLANKIFNENNVSWKNYFDINKEFPKKLNAGGYPLFIIVDRNGKILSKELGGQETLESTLEQYVK